MRHIRRFRHLMASTVQIAPRASLDEYGKPTYGTAISYSAHLSRQPKMVRTPEMQDVLSTQSIYLDGHPPVLETAQVTLSTGDVGSTETVLLQPLIRSVDRRFDQGGAHHTVVYI